MTFITFLAGLTLLVVGAELLVRGASQLAISLGLSALVIGLTVVAFGTSAPELAVSIGSSFSGHADLAIGNIVGSNIMNVLFILGVSSIISPLIISKQLIRLDVPVMIAVSILTWLLALDGKFTRFEGVVLFSGLIAYTITLIRLGNNDDSNVDSYRPVQVDADPTSIAIQGKSLGLNIGLVLAGLAVLVLGSNLLVSSATVFARSWGISEAVIGATIVAGGTSLPELATCVVAAFKGQRDLAVGNIVGSNVFNLLCVLGLTAAASPVGIDVLPDVVNFDFPVMVATALICLPVFFTGGEISRWEGLILLGYYFAYATFLILSTTQVEGTNAFQTAMLFFVIPLTLLAMAAYIIPAVRRHRAQSNRNN